jgi:diaminopimelate epimerase
VSLRRTFIPFVKASACGNDFLLIDAAQIEGKITPEEIGSFTQHICDRHNGVGADGVEWLYPHASADVEIRLINADGSEAEISGNGTRCVAAYLYAERGMRTIVIQTGAGPKTCTLIGETETEYEFEVDMGEATVESADALKVNGAQVSGVPVSIGNPHFVVFVSEFSSNWRNEAAAIQRSPEFKNGVNIEFVAVDNRHNVRVRFFERGVGETQSSGTGSCASAIAAIAAGKAESPVRVHAPGGTQTIRTEGSRVFLRGSARLVCRGDFFSS